MVLLDLVEFLVGLAIWRIFRAEHWGRAGGHKAAKTSKIIKTSKCANSNIINQMNGCCCCCFLFALFFPLWSVHCGWSPHRALYLPTDAMRHAIMMSTFFTFQPIDSLVDNNSPKARLPRMSNAGALRWLTIAVLVGLLSRCRFASKQTNR